MLRVRPTKRQRGRVRVGLLSGMIWRIKILLAFYLCLYHSVGSSAAAVGRPAGCVAFSDFFEDNNSAIFCGVQTVLWRTSGRFCLRECLGEHDHREFFWRCPDRSVGYVRVALLTGGVLEGRTFVNFLDDVQILLWVVVCCMGATSV